MTRNPAAAGSLPAYLAGLGTWSAAFGMGMVIVQWVVVDLLHQPADRLGLVQMCLLAPSILLLPWGGTAADLGDARRQLLICHVLAALPSLGLAGLALGGRLSLGAMIVYALAIGATTAFVMPARDGLLPRVTSAPLPKAVAMVTGAQYLCQLLGISLATAADAVGAAPLLATQASLVLAGAVAVWRMSPQAPTAAAGSATNGLAALRDGLRVARQSPQIWPVLVLLLGVGIFFVAAFIVAIPIVVRDVHGGGSVRLALANLAFWAGVIVASFGLVRLGATSGRHGRLLVVALGCAMLVLLAISTLPSFAILLALLFLWGASAGVIMAEGRAIVQMAAPASYRSRILALYQLGIMGGAPLGAPVMGAVTRTWDPTAAMWVAVGCMSCVVTMVATRSSIWRDEARADRPA